ncbi:MAG: hypothetical protein F6K24_05065 [Okeania sp. SIO2D1]|nr:hypothetical protein [Okeania sp. SIO2D1]
MYLNKGIATKPKIPIVLGSVTNYLGIEAIAISSVETYSSYIVLLRHTQ